jgi:two-component system sensor histidine kinase PilS (NtrC family)
LVRIYNYYRVLVGFALLATFSQGLFDTRLGELNETFFWWMCVLYTFANIVSALLVQFAPQSWFNRQYLNLTLVLFDVITLTFLMYFSGGIGSGIAALILVTVATGAILLTGRLTALVAATASIALLYEEFYLSISSNDFAYDFFQAGIFGVIYFASALSIQSLSNRIRSNDIRALTQAVELADLERLNRLIIQRMRTGIIVVDQDDHVRMCNQSARALLGISTEAELMTLPSPLLDHLTSWRKEPNFRAPPFQVHSHTPEIRANFSAVRVSESVGDVTIFLEDTGEVQQQAQQLKLAELGRLSASIAHEVRNPLGAISHAAQLLNESTELEPGDQRLTDIIVNHCRRMDGVVENVLEMAQRKTPEPVRVGLRKHLDDFVGQFKQAVPEADLTATVEPADTEIRVDPTQLSQVLTNLVQNGIRYSFENGAGHKVRLEGGLDRSSDRPFLNVIDFGPGVDIDQEGNLFQPFSTTERKGTGLGLYISRELCEANQARLTYIKHEGGGSCFRILFAHPDRITF